MKPKSEEDYSNKGEKAEEGRKKARKPERFFPFRLIRLRGLFLTFFMYLLS
jgi:hypothetical protein